MNYYKMTQFFLSKVNCYTINVKLQRYRHTKHWNPKYKKERQEKVIKINFSELQPNEDNISYESKRTKMKEKGIFPQKPWLEKPMYISCTGSVFEPYVPPEGDGKFSAISTIGAKQNIEFLMKKTKSYQAFKKIKRYEEEFNVKEFADQVVRIYIEAHNALSRKNERELMNFATEKLFPEMLYNLKNKTVMWKFIKSLEPARVVHARCTSLLTDNNIFAQVTVRLHTQQMLALYDRFGRLMNGSEIIKKDVLEYIVLEKHLSNEYGKWRLHSKIVPSWMPLCECIAKTFVMN